MPRLRKYLRAIFALALILFIFGIAWYILIPYAERTIAEKRRDTAALLRLLERGDDGNRVQTLYILIDFQRDGLVTDSDREFIGKFQDEKYGRQVRRLSAEILRLEAEMKHDTAALLKMLQQNDDGRIRTLSILTDFQKKGLLTDSDREIIGKFQDEKYGQQVIWLSAEILRLQEESTKPDKKKDSSSAK